MLKHVYQIVFIIAAAINDGSAMLKVHLQILI